jgi:hypothetical protein
MTANPQWKFAEFTPHRAASNKRSRQKRGRRHQPRQNGNIFLPGQPIPETGIYEVIHDRPHRETHEAVLRSGEPFPVCDECGIRVRFKLVRSAPYIFDDEDFRDQGPDSPRR